ncbi:MULTISPECIES: DUF2461 domain-containing protein [Acidobacterium]|uniref:TIGR02453 family protein n=1 Tax=Acidobacterium capsulatum (strain ATCC 51196 / DSM 11244 / BCRC 80197 / JCM 7670 / NBRC 15755 / NCIMB 13165 / 161) TaxID=240015 RepID=C1F8W8_ACIC5|nr:MULTISPECIES: DUF2461 domain-containing protein [Acidobacterium]ACO31401.1 conserved hypothetical protein TIGR02453 [Acidobacterium capsulatum ATCC 51196]HCT59892.1 DUF2461 domain-containing protein [Acidobacterium sp.]
MSAVRKQTTPPSTALPYFHEEALRFLRGLKRNNRREWFEARRAIFERELKAPMLALIESVTQGMIDYAPDHMREARRVMLRFYRDTRFSADKSPYKQHIAAWWGRGGMQKTSGAGYYLHLSGTELIVAAGVYMPGKDQLLAIRRYLLDHYEEFGTLLEDRKMRRSFGLHDPLALTRAPKGFPVDHPAAEWIRWRQWGVTTALPAEAALTSQLPRTVQSHFALAAPLVGFLNRAILSAAPPGARASSTARPPLALY